MMGWSSSTTGCVNDGNVLLECFFLIVSEEDTTATAASMTLCFNVDVQKNYCLFLLHLLNMVKRLEKNDKNAHLVAFCGKKSSCCWIFSLAS